MTKETKKVKKEKPPEPSVQELKLQIAATESRLDALADRVTKLIDALLKSKPLKGI